MESPANNPLTFFSTNQFTKLFINTWAHLRNDLVLNIHNCIKIGHIENMIQWRCGGNLLEFFCICSFNTLKTKGQELTGMENVPHWRISLLSQSLPNEYIFKFLLSDQSEFLCSIVNVQLLWLQNYFIISHKVLSQIRKRVAGKTKWALIPTMPSLVSAICKDNTFFLPAFWMSWSLLNSSSIT